MSNERDGPCIGVLGGSGGAGASSLAAAIAACAGVGAVLVDLDVHGGGMDVVLGIEKESGTRWSGLHSDGGRIDPAEVAVALPRWGEVWVLSCDRDELPPVAVRSVWPRRVRSGRWWSTWIARLSVRERSPWPTAIWWRSSSGPPCPVWRRPRVPWLDCRGGVLSWPPVGASAVER